MQFVPDNGVYVYFRYDKKQSVMCMMNPEKEPKKISINRFAEMTLGKSKAIDVVTGATHDLTEITVPPKTVLVLELQ